MTKNKNKQDPHFKREASRYREPIVSREVIADHIAKSEKSLSLVSLINTFSLQSAREKEALRRRLRAMVRDGQLHCNAQGEYGLIDTSSLIDGIVDIARDGRGRVVVGENDTFIELSSVQLKQVFPGDRVLVNIVGVGVTGCAKGAITKILSRAHTELVGRFHLEQGIGYVVPENSSIRQDIMVLAGDTQDAKNAQFVSVKITTWPTKRTQAVGKVVKVLGDSMSSTLAIEVAKKTFDLPIDWPKSLLKQLEQLPKEVVATGEDDRQDLTALPFITIDGEDAMDFDDAVFAKETATGFTLLVAIADVSHYVALDSPLDIEAIKRGTSVYFPNHVLPMLPEALSNELCSLKPDVARLTLVCEMTISKQGMLDSFMFYKGMIHSKARLTYHEVADYLQDGQFKQQDVADTVKLSINTLNSLYHVLLKARDKRGALAFSSLDTRMVLNKTGQVEKIIATERNDAHKLIEECMLMANVAAAHFILKQNVPALFRVHGAPDSEKITNLRDFLSFRGVALKGGAVPNVNELNDAVKAFDGHEDKLIVENVVLRSMQQAIYTPENQGHYGLGYDAYAHFTSPIRRYPDLIVHRVIKSLLSKEDGRGHRYSLKTLTELGVSTSFTERRAEDASRDVEKSLKCAFMAEKVGERYFGVISGVTNFGFFVTITSLLVDGLVHCKNLRDDYYIFDEKRHVLVGQRTRRAFQFGDEVEVQVANVDLSDRKIDFELVGEHALKRPKKFQHQTAKSKTRSPSSAVTKTKRKETKANDHLSSAQTKSKAKKNSKKSVKRIKVNRKKQKNSHSKKAFKGKGV